MKDHDYLLIRIQILEGIVRATMDIFALTATPEQLDLLNKLGREANYASVRLEGEYKNENPNQ